MKLRKYLRVVCRRLDVPKQLKDRIMEDFVSSIDARKENGQEEAAILAELGAPKMAARELNQQMREYTYRKSPWRWVCLAVAILSGLCLAYQGLPGLLLMLFNKSYNAAASIGVIGGADGPTAIFVTTKPSATPLFMIYGSFILLGLVGFLLLRKLKQK